ncbi:MAG TPA: molybdopterin cofactor-binding domain-containing protein [Anaerolineaceae bacterium]|nr:molybdopterin cofactor-binding domain-containing protein [Anaerolineaceae bacterium]
MKRRGIGFASSFQGVNYHFGHPDVSTVELHVTEDNGLLVRTAASDLGEGLEAMLLLVVSRSFNGFPIENIRWEGSNTNSPEAGGTGASRQSTLTGNAAQQACLSLQELLRSVASELLDVHPAEVLFDGSAAVAGVHRVPLEAVFAEARKMGVSLTVQGSFQAPQTTPLDFDGPGGRPVNQFGYATHAAEVEVDTVTGEVRVIRLVAFHDAGVVLNRLGATAQVEGAAVMGMGFALSEDYLLKDGRPVNVGFTNYLIPSIADAPEIETHFVETPSPIGPLGLKGLAEIPVSTVVPAVINAIYNACGVRVRHIPATPERVLSALVEGE